MAEEEIHAYLIRKESSSTGSNNSLLYPLTKIQGQATIGREKCDIITYSKFASRIHAELSFENSIFKISIKSGNGLYLNTRKLLKGESRFLRSGDIITIGFGEENPDTFYFFKINSLPFKLNKLKTAAIPSNPDEVITISDGDDDIIEIVDLSNRKRKRDPSPEKLALMKKNMELEKRIKELESGNEIKQAEMFLKEQDLDTKVSSNECDQNKLLVVPTSCIPEESRILENDLKRIEEVKIKELAMQLEREGLEGILTEKDKQCNLLKNRLTEAEQQLKDKDTELKKTISTTVGTVENELQCSICSELFIKAVTLSCTHSFCEFCIHQWMFQKKECPMCRKMIKSVVPSLVLDNFISQYFAAMSIDLQKQRQELIAKRHVQNLKKLYLPNLHLS